MADFRLLLELSTAIVSSLNAGIVIVGEYLLESIPAFVVVMLPGAACVGCSASRTSFSIAISE